MTWKTFHYLPKTTCRELFLQARSLLLSLFVILSTFFCVEWKYEKLTRNILWRTFIVIKFEYFHLWDFIKTLSYVRHKQSFNCLTWFVDQKIKDVLKIGSSFNVFNTDLGRLTIFHFSFFSRGIDHTQRKMTYRQRSSS